jgi:hypothetical protein
MTAELYVTLLLEHMDKLLHELEMGMQSLKKEMDGKGTDAVFIAFARISMIMQQSFTNAFGEKGEAMMLFGRDHKPEIEAYIADKPDIKAKLALLGKKLNFK